MYYPPPPPHMLPLLGIAGGHSINHCGKETGEVFGGLNVVSADRVEARTAEHGGLSVHAFRAKFHSNKEFQSKSCLGR